MHVEEGHTGVFLDLAVNPRITAKNGYTTAQKKWQHVAGQSHRPWNELADFCAQGDYHDERPGIRTRESRYPNLKRPTVNTP